MISKNKIKYIHSLEQKKNRNAEGVFVAEGPKVVGDLMPKMEARLVVGTAKWMAANWQMLSLMGVETVEVGDEELRKVSFLQHPQDVLAVFCQRDAGEVPSAADCGLSIMLDGVQDPGNLGTIVRIADWFGIEHIFCSRDTADVYNPKVVQATMGSIARVNVAYADLPQLVDGLPSDFPVYGTLLDGDDIYGQQLSANGLIVMGNEGNGLSPQMRQRVNRRLRIPSFPIGRATAESLNVAVATAIVCSEFRRNKK